MEFSNKVAIVTGGASGIGKAVAEALHARGVKVAVADLNADAASAVGEACGGFGGYVDVRSERSVAGFITKVEKTIGPVDIYFSNAGIGVSDGPGWGAADAPNESWNDCWNINVMGSVYAARHLARPMAERGGAFIITASAAGLLAQIGDAAYSATKAAAVSFAECLAITHADDGLQVHCLCPEGVRTPLVEGMEGGAQGLSGYMEASDVADILLSAVEDNRFLVTTHEQTPGFTANKGNNRDKWVGGMRKLRRMVLQANNGRPF